MGKNLETFVGFVEEALPGANFKVRFTINGQERTIRCYLSGKMYKNRIYVGIGDYVSATIEKDYSLGRIVRRN